MITGGAGFIGSHVVRLFVNKYPEYRIINLDKLTYAGNLANLKDVEDKENYVFVKADICDYETIKKLMNDYDIDGIIHLAAESHVDRSIKDPFTFAHTNVIGTLTLLQAAKEYWESKPEGYEGKRFYHISTDEVYGALELTNPEGIESPFTTKASSEHHHAYGTEFFTEETKYNPHSPYSASKASSDHFVRKERQKYIFDRPLPIEMNSNSYTEELGYTWKKVHEYLNSRIKWRHDGSSFNSVKVKFTILKENPLTPGCKLTGRYGNKGVVSLIEKSEKMPQTENGIKIDILLNPYGVINRMNISQLYEQKINFMSNHVVDIMKSKTTRKEKEHELFMYLLEINETEYNFVAEKYQKMTEEEKNNFIKDIEENGIYIHQRPFFGNITARDFLRINKEHPERCTKYKCTNLEKPITVGEVYFMRLKHESSNKSSIRSTDSINQKGLPLKSNVVKEHTKLFANTPIRFGEMEVANLMLCKDPEIVGEFMQTYSTSRIGREALVEKLLTAPDPLNITVEYTEDKSITRRILDQYLKVIELGLED